MTIGIVLATVLRIFSAVIVIQAILSWIPAREGPVERIRWMLRRITEPVLGPIRRVVRPVGLLDFSSLLVLVAINIFLIPLALRL